MTRTDPGATSPQPPAQKTLGQRAIRGVLVYTGQSLALRATSLVTQVALAWLLTRDDFGLISLTYMVASIVTLARRAGVRDVLVHRGDRMHLWATPAFWLSVGSGVLSSVMLVIAAPIVSWVFHAPQLQGLLLVMALVPLIDSTAAVAVAKLQRDMRFGVLSVADYFGYGGVSVMAVVFALMGFGVYSFVIPQPIAAAIRTGILHSQAHLPIKMRPMIGRWKYLLVDSLRMLGAEFCELVGRQIDYMMLGLFKTKDVLGLYFFAFNLSSQTNRLISKNISGVLFPALSSLQADRERQARAFERAINGLAVVATPVALLQAALADPVFKLVFEPEWYPSIRLLQWLSLGLALAQISTSAEGMMKANGQFGLVMWLSVSRVVLIGLAAGLGAAFSDVETVAIGVSAVIGLYGPLRLWFAFRVVDVGAWRVATIYGRVLAVSGLAIGPAMYLSSLIDPATSGRDVMRIVIILLSTAVLYPLLVRWWMPQTWEDMLNRARQVLGRRRPASPAMNQGPTS